MTSRQQSIYNFLKYEKCLLSSDETAQQHYNAKQINLFSKLKVTDKELKEMEAEGYLTHIYTKFHGNCYYAL